MTDNMPLPLSIYNPPGFRSSINYSYQMLEFGRQIRDEALWQYPLLPGAVYTYQQMASGREWKVSGKPRAVVRAVEFMNNAQSLQYDGTVDYGLEQFMRRRSLDYIAVGMTIFDKGDGQTPLRYLDPTNMYYELENKQWVERYTQEVFPSNRIVVNKPIPIGTLGNFVSPLSFIIPTAMLAWLVREHDRASADGRKLRDIIVVGSQDMADTIQEAIQDALALYSGADPKKHGVPIAYVELLSGNGSRSVADMFARLGLANIPDNFDREGFQFQYVNEISACLGLALRHFWNSEKATNRALEEVQEARQAQKGPNAFNRTEQRIYNSSGMLEDRFGKNTRFSVIEEVDLASRKTDAEVMKAYAESLQILITAFGGEVNGKAFLSWMQSLDALPPDLELITDIGIRNENQMDMPSDNNRVINSDSTIQKSIEMNGSLDTLEYDEISMNGSGHIIEKRFRVFSVAKALEAEVDVVSKPHEKQVISFSEALKVARNKNVERFKEYVSERKSLSEIESEIFERINQLTDDDHRKIKVILDSMAS